jgi:HEAT repeat protein
MTNLVRQHLSLALDWEHREEERAAAVEELGMLGDAGVVIPLGILLGQTTPGRLRSALTSTLARLSAADVMISELSSPDSGAREIAAQVLSSLGDRRAIEPLMIALTDPTPRVREEACTSLFEFRAVEAVVALTRCLLEDVDPDVRMAAAQALGEIDDHSALAALERATEIEKDEFTMILIEQSIQRYMDRAYQ